MRVVYTLGKRGSGRLFLSGMLALFFSGLFILLFSRAMNRTFSHDEHQFIASGELLLAGGALPFRDYPYLHLPYLAVPFALSGALSDYLLLGARTVSVMAATGSAVALYALVNRFFQGLFPAGRVLLGAGAVLVLVTNPLFYITSGKAWNHDLPTLFTLGAVLLLWTEGRGAPAAGAVFSAGLLLGLAAGTRASYLTALAPFAGWVYLEPAGMLRHKRLRRVGLFLAGFVLALLPVAILFVLEPRAFVFGNIVYPQLNAVYRMVLRQQEAMTLGGKFIYLVETISMDWQSIFLYLAFLAILLAWIIGRRTPGGRDRRGWIMPTMVFFMLAGSLAPTPSWSHYYYAPLPFIVLAYFYSLAQVLPGRRALLLLAALFPVAAGLANYAGQDLAHLRSLGRPSGWVTVRSHLVGEALAAQVGQGRVLTLAPVFPLEGGLEVYPEFATGPFAWRTGHLLSRDRQQLYGVVSRESLRAYLDAGPPAAILTGFEADTAGFEPGDPGGLEAPLIDYAVARGYLAIELEAQVTGDTLLLWMPPGR